MVECDALKVRQAHAVRIPGDENKYDTFMNSLYPYLQPFLEAKGDNLLINKSVEKNYNAFAWPGAREKNYSAFILVGAREKNYSASARKKLRVSAKKYSASALKNLGGVISMP